MENVDPNDAYAAGLIDGEGCLGISKKLTVTVDVGMTEPALPLLRELAARYGGKVRPFRKATETWSAAYTWTLTGAKATQMLELLLPHLRLKREQAKLLIECQGLRKEMPLNRFNRPGWTPQLLASGQKIREKVMALNRKGPRTDAAPPAGAVWRRPQTSLLEPSGELFKGTWPRSHMWVAQTVYPLPPLAPRTSVTGSSRSPLLPTPLAQQKGPSSRRGANAQGGPALHHVLLPTPTATPYGSNQSPSKGAAVRPSLESLAAGASTPEQSSDGKKSPAPLLNPSFVEWMLGLPEGWSDPDCPRSAMAFRSRQASSSDAASCDSSRND